jgi:hypothetical protein
MCLPCSAIRAEDVRRRVARSDKHGAERPEKFSIYWNEQEDAYASHHWTRGDNFARADVEGQFVGQRASRFYHVAEVFEGWKAIEGHDGDPRIGGRRSYARSHGWYSEANRQDARAVAELPGGRQSAGRETPQERYVQGAGELKGPAPRRECGFRLVCLLLRICSRRSSRPRTQRA